MSVLFTAHNHHHSHKKHGGGDQDISDEQQTNIYGSGRNADTMYQRSGAYSDDNTDLQYPTQDQDSDEYSEASWNIQTGGGPQNINSNGQLYGQSYRGIGGGQMSKSRGGELYRQRPTGFESASSESGSLEDYIKEQDDGDIATEIGRKVAEKMVKFFNIVEKYAARNGTVLAGPAQEPLPLRQWAIPMANHHYLNMADNKINGLSQGIIKSMYINTEMNSVSTLNTLFPD